MLDRATQKRWLISYGAINLDRALDEPLLENTIERFTNIRDDAQIGFGVGDYLGDVFGEAMLNLPTPQIEARVPQLDD